MTDAALPIIDPWHLRAQAAAPDRDPAAAEALLCQAADYIEALETRLAAHADALMQVRLITQEADDAIARARRAAKMVAR